MSRFNIFRTNKYHHVSEEAFRKKMGMQRLLNSKVLDLFTRYGGSKTEQEVEFFFYTDEEDKAINLAIELDKLGYEVYGIDQSSPSDKWCISGRTTPMKMNNKAMTKWSKQMVELGYRCDCDFDGWGTLIE